MKGLNMFKLHYHISNGGDGSASVRLHNTAEEAEIADANMDCGWGEPCNGSIELKLENGNLFYRDYVCIDEKTYKYEYQWLPVEKVS